MNSALKRLIKKKQRTYNRAKKYQREEDWIEYKNLQHQTKSTIRQRHTQYLSNISNPQNGDNRMKRFWHYIKGKRQDNIGIGALKNQTGNIVTDSSEKAEILNEQFKSVFTIEDTTCIPDMGVSPYPPISNIDITVNGVRNLLDKCDVNKSPGPDNIHGTFLKHTASEIAPLLTHLFQQSLDTGTVPTSWKQANVTPIFKKGDKLDPRNYRPVSLTSLVCKTLEHILTSQIMKYLEANSILTDVQYGFRSKRSCEAQLFLTIDDFARALDSKLQVDVAILDFAKAFDKVAHARLAQKLNFYGIRGQLLQWLQSFLANRSQQVVVDGRQSSLCNVTSGVPQGSVLGPVLFLLYINDIVTNIHSQMRLFADDCLIYRPIHSPEDQNILQSDLDKLSAWGDVWQMKFNVQKCCIMQLSTSPSTNSFCYTMCRSPLQVVEEHNYLGILLDNKLSWTPHINSLCRKANRLLGFLRRTLHHCPSHLKEHAYKQIVLPSVEYCCPIWDPDKQTSIRKLEMIQHRAARFVLNRPWRRDCRDSVTDMLTTLHWQTLEKRRKQSRLMLLFKFTNSLIYVPNLYLPALSPVVSTRANHPLKLRHSYIYTPEQTVIEAHFYPRQ